MSDNALVIKISAVAAESSHRNPAGYDLYEVSKVGESTSCIHSHTAPTALYSQLIIIELVLMLTNRRERKKGHDTWNPT